MPVISKEQIAEFKRWQIESFDAPAAGVKPEKAPAAAKPSPSEAQAAPEITLPTVESLERMHEEARKAGYDEGYASGEKAGLDAGLDAGRKAGYEEGAAQAKKEAERLALLADHFQKSLATLDQEVADAVLDLSLSIARQVVQHQLQTQPESIIGVIRSALSSLPLHHGNITITLHPEDARLLREHLGNQIAQSGWHLIEDPDFERGGCQLRAGSSEVDATFATRWRRVLEALGKPDGSET